MWISLKMYRSKLMMVNTFHGDPSPSLRWWRATADGCYVESSGGSRGGSKGAMDPPFLLSSLVEMYVL